jgi:hypothetical protein
LFIEAKTLVFDFDETLAKVDVGTKKLPEYDDQVEIFTRDKIIQVFNIIN